MNKLNKSIRVITLVIISGFFLISQAIATDSNGIKIDNNKKMLVAPKGEKYQWYQNGKLLADQNQRYLEVHNSGRYLVEMKDENGEQKTEIIQVAVTAGTIHKIYVIGDSTVQTYNSSYYPQQGWGAVLHNFFDVTKFEVDNYSIGGRSSKSFFVEGRWETVKNLLDSGDYVFIQWGINDRDWTHSARYTPLSPIDSFSMFLRIYVNDTREKGAIPVLISPMVMCSVDRNVYTEPGSNYRGAVYNVSQELNVAFVDLDMLSFANNKAAGLEYIKYFWYKFFEPGEYPNYPNGFSNDWTHFQEMGALEMSKLIMEGLQELNADTNIAKLIAAMTPLYHVEVDANIPDAGLYTHSDDYPAGANVTIKTRLNNGYAFYRWEDDSSHVVSTDNLYMFTMQAKDYNFIASLKDCNDSIGGTARYDACAICSGGNTNKPVCSGTSQSESACNYDGTIENQVVNGMTKYFVNTAGTSQAEFVYAVSTDITEEYQIGLVCQASDTSYHLSIYVNDVLAFEDLEIEKLPDWQLKLLDLDLAQGTNEIKVVTNSEMGGIKFDQLTYYSDNLSKGQCHVSGVKQVSSSDLIVFPNPFVESAKIHGIEHSRYAIFNVLGLLVDEGICTKDCSIGTTLERGIYLLSVQDGNDYQTQVIQKL